MKQENNKKEKIEYSKTVTSNGVNKSNLVTIVIIVLVLGISAFFAWKAQDPGENASNSEAARSLNIVEGAESYYTDLDGNPADLSMYEGQVRVVNSWAGWCPFCIEELKDFESLAAEFKEEEVAVIAINRREPAKKAKAFLSQLGTFENIIFIQDEGDTFYRSIGGFAMPETIFYNTDGSVFLHKRGFMDLEEMRTHLENLLRQENS